MLKNKTLERIRTHLNICSNDTINSQARDLLSALHGDEGLTTIEIVLLLFVAVIILVAVIAYFNHSVWTAITNAINGLLGTHIGQ